MNGTDVCTCIAKSQMTRVSEYVIRAKLNDREMIIVMKIERDPRLEYRRRAAWGRSVTRTDPAAAAHL